jgi:hypothetical protein
LQAFSGETLSHSPTENTPSTKGRRGDPWFLSRISAFSKGWRKFESGPTVILYDSWCNSQGASRHRDGSGSRQKPVKEEFNVPLNIISGYLP